jgi:5-(carboxyamino)imidazole ribonucleotide synthase
MLNVLGDAWLSQPSGQPRWDKVLALPQTKLHLYNKLEAKEGRKMAHINITANSPEEAFHTAKLLKADLLSSN